MITNAIVSRTVFFSDIKLGNFVLVLGIIRLVISGIFYMEIRGANISELIL